MIDVERRRTIQAPARTIRAILVDIEHMQQLMPRISHVEVRGNTDNRARLALDFRAGRFGTKRIEGEARMLDDGLRFVAVRPAQIDARWSVQERDVGTEVTARLTIDTAALLGSIDRFVPRAFVERRIARELDASLTALEDLSQLSQFLLGLALSILAGGLSFRRGLLTGSGWAAAVVVGTLTAGIGGWEWGLLLILFFASSSALSRLGARRKQQFVAEQWEKGDRRDWGQVFANGGLFGLLALAWAVIPSEPVWAAGLGVLATATGDTWATELGVLSRRAPRLITNGRVVAPGTSGGITMLGSLAALAGAACIAAGGLLLGRLFQHESPWWLFPVVLVGGVAGVAVDSLLGATVQAMYWCPRCGKETERRVHGCGTRTTPLRGWTWLANDAVNALASLAGGVIAAAIALWITRG